MRRLAGILSVLSLVLMLGGTSSAGGRPDKGQNWFGHIAAGYSLAQGAFGDIVDDDFYIDAGATYWPEGSNFGINLDVSFDDRDINSSVIRAINNALPPAAGSLTGGDVSTWGFSVNGIWGGKNSSGLYVIAGVGLDDIKGSVNDDVLVYYPPVCDPWFWWCYPGGVGPGNAVVASESVTEFTWNAGLGWSFDLSSGSQVYIEARYKTAETDRESTETIPLVIGFRW